MIWINVPRRNLAKNQFAEISIAACHSSASCSAGHLGDAERGVAQGDQPFALGNSIGSANGRSHDTASTISFPPKKVRPRIAPRPAAVPGYIRPNSIRFQLFSYLSPGSTLWRIDNNTLANDEVHCLPVDVGPNHFEFERVISGQGLTRLRRQQLGPTLNI